MTAAEIEIIIGANTDEAIAAFKKLGYTITQTGKDAAKFTQKGKTDFTNLGRVIQDLPFGVIGIQNNLTQLVSGAGAFGLALSVVTAAVTFAQVGFSNWTRGLGQTKEQVDEVNKSIAGAQTEIVKISSLLSIARGLGESTEARTNAIKELQKEYPGYLANLNLENVNSQETANAVQLLSEALTRKAKVQAVSNLLTKANEKLLTAESQTINDNIVSVNSFLGLLKSGLGLSASGGAVGALAGAAKETTENISEAEGEVRQLSNTLAELTQEQARNSDFSLLSPTAHEKLKKVAEAFQQINAFIKGRGKFDNVTALENGKFITNEIQKQLDQGPPLKVPPFDFDKTDIANKAKALGSIVRDTLVNALAGIGEAIGNLISGAANPFSNLFNIIGSGIKALGKQMLEYAVLQELMLTSLGSLNPFLSAAVGVALVALGSVISNMGAVQKFATGGVVTSPTLALVGERGPERITPLGYENSASNMGIGVVQFEIQGEKLYGVLRRYEKTRINTF